MSEQSHISPTPKEEPATDPSVLGGNVTPPFDEEIYNKKVDLLEDVLKKQTAKNLAAQRTVLINVAGGHREAEQVDIWEAIKQREAHRAYAEVTSILAAEVPATSKPIGDRDVFDKLITSVALDIRGTTDPNRVQSGADVVDFNIGSELDNLLDGEELDDPAVLAKATKTIRLLVADGQYKLYKWGNADQLKTALELVETYAKWIQDFEPREAGFDEARSSLTLALAALQVDQDSKPNYQYAKPERNYLFTHTAQGLKQLRKTEAHMFLRYRDFQLPQPKTNQPEAD